MNPRQNALLDLKKSAIRNLEFDDFFKMFGQGPIAGCQRHLRAQVACRSDRLGRNRSGTRKSSGSTTVASHFIIEVRRAPSRGWSKSYTDKVIRVRPHLDAILVNADTVGSKKTIYEKHLREKFWSGLMKFTLNRDTTMSHAGCSQGPASTNRNANTRWADPVHPGLHGKRIRRTCP